MSDFIKNRYELMFYVACANGNPNGDPDMDNSPRIDPDTGIGLISDAAIKRRIRNYVQMAHGDEDGMDIIIKQQTNINRFIAVAKDAAGVKLDDKSKAAVAAGAEMACQKFFDVRAFGAVMSTGPNAGQVRGPVQVCFGQSIDPIQPIQTAITRMACAENIKGDQSVAAYEEYEMKADESKLRTIGRKYYIPFGLYEVRVFISANLARETGFSDKDFNTLCEAIMGMYEHDHSSSKGEMAVVGPLIIFKHIGLSDPVHNPEENEKSAILGCAPAHKLFELVNVSRKPDIEVARSYKDYDASINLSAVPRGVEVGFFDGFNFSWGEIPSDETWLKAE